MGWLVFIHQVAFTNSNNITINMTHTSTVASFSLSDLSLSLIQRVMEMSGISSHPLKKC